MLAAYINKNHINFFDEYLLGHASIDNEARKIRIR